MQKEALHCINKREQAVAFHSEKNELTKSLDRSTGEPGRTFLPPKAVGNRFPSNGCGTP
jgi:hypothetical protein